MPKDRFNISPYHTLPLTLKDQRMLLEIENDLVEDTFRKYEAYVMSNSQVNLARWKHVKSKDNLHIYAKKTNKALRYSPQCCQPTIDEFIVKYIQSIPLWR
ncbi:hypothetical protein PR002_g3880 [Phytophthora rubi]|uniref:Uncharacterized protein n=1 Tax=Phytophthora rubi TaxID=129364 RepID=A0A6A3NN83_9STRA|nr:hypothetical protein PR002_g3880 [Phytophthora rubi]